MLFAHLVLMKLLEPSLVYIFLKISNTFWYEISETPGVIILLVIWLARTVVVETEKLEFGGSIMWIFINDLGEGIEETIKKTHN